MKPIRISYSKTYPLGFTGAFEKIYIEADVEEGEQVRDALYAAKRVVEAFHFESNNADKKQQVSDATPPPERPKDLEGGLIFDLNTCTDAAVLKQSYEWCLERYPKVKEAYLQKLKSLQ